MAISKRLTKEGYRTASGGYFVKSQISNREIKIKRDEKKRQICKANNIELIYFTKDKFISAK